MADEASERTLEALDRINEAAARALGTPAYVYFAEADAQDGGGFEAMLAMASGGTSLVVGRGETRVEALRSLARKLAGQLDEEARNLSRVAGQLREAGAA